MMKVLRSILLSKDKGTVVGCTANDKGTEVTSIAKDEGTDISCIADDEDEGPNIN